MRFMAISCVKITYEKINKKKEREKILINCKILKIIKENNNKSGKKRESMRNKPVTNTGA